MQGFKSVLQIIFYFIWIPLGILLFVLVIFLIINNPLRQLSPMGGGVYRDFKGGGPSGGPGADEVMQKQQMMQKGGQNGPGKGSKEGTGQPEDFGPKQ